MDHDFYPEPVVHARVLEESNRLSALSERTIRRHTASAVSAAVPHRLTLFGTHSAFLAMLSRMRDHLSSFVTDAPRAMPPLDDVSFPNKGAVDDRTLFRLCVRAASSYADTYVVYPTPCDCIPRYIKHWLHHAALSHRP